MAGRFKIGDPKFEMLDPVLEAVGALLRSIKVEVGDVVHKVVNHTVATSIGQVEFEELFINGAHGLKVGEGIVTWLILWPMLGGEMPEPRGSDVHLPGLAQQVVVGKSHDACGVSRNEEVAMQPQGGNAANELNRANGCPAKAACYPSDRKVLNPAHVLEV